MKWTIPTSWIFPHIKVQKYLLYNPPLILTDSSAKRGRCVFKILRFLALQYSVLSILVSITMIVLTFFKNHPAIVTALGYLKATILVSVGAAIYSLILYLYNFQKDIEKYKPFWKFFSIKIVLFFSVWQRIALKTIKISERFKLDDAVSSGVTSESYIDNLLVVLEMLFLSIVVNKYYSYQEYSQDNVKGFASSRRNCCSVPKIL